MYISPTHRKPPFFQKLFAGILQVSDWTESDNTPEQSRRLVETSPSRIRTHAYKRCSNTTPNTSIHTQINNLSFALFTFTALVNCFRIINQTSLCRLDSEYYSPTCFCCDGSIHLRNIGCTNLEESITLMLKISVDIHYYTK